METVRIAFEPALDEGARQRIVVGIDDYCIAATGLADYFPVAFTLRDEHDELLGGVLGHVWGGWLQVTHLWVAGPFRGLGHGKRLMESAEAYGRRRGAMAAALETYSFQARPFYEALGYELFSVLEGYPPGHAKFFLRKMLA